MGVTSAYHRRHSPHLLWLQRKPVLFHSSQGISKYRIYTNGFYKWPRLQHYLPLYPPSYTFYPILCKTTQV